MARFPVRVLVGLGGAVVGAKLALRARLGAREYEVPVSTDLGGSDGTASYPILPPAADWAAPVGALGGALIFLVALFLVSRLVRGARESANARSAGHGESFI